MNFRLQILVYLDNVWLKLEGQGHRSWCMDKTQEENVAKMVGATLRPTGCWPVVPTGTVADGCVLRCYSSKLESIMLSRKCLYEH